MNIVDKITSESRLIVDSVKDTLSRNIVSASRSKMIDLNEDQLNKLLNLVNVSLDEGYQKVLTSYQKKIRHLVEK